MELECARKLGMKLRRLPLMVQMETGLSVAISPVVHLCTIKECHPKSKELEIKTKGKKE
jgi:hypothetical protein